MNRKLTSSDIKEFEADSLIEALGYELELNDEFLRRYCSEEFTEIISKIPERDRGYILQGLKESHWFNGFPTCDDCQDIWLDISEIEWQFEGNPTDVFLNPEDFTIHGDLAYLYVGYGLSVEFDREELLKAVNDYLSITQP